MKESREHFKKQSDELQEYLLFRRRGSAAQAKKGKGSKYKRQPKHKGKEE